MNIFIYPYFIYSWIKYKILSEENVPLQDLYPCLNDRGAGSQTGKGHYFFQDIWALRCVMNSSVGLHVDVGSRIDGFVGQCSAICDIEMVEYRPIGIGIDNIRMIPGDILNLPYADKEVRSLSCLHVIEHIGLGRYGDRMDPLGSEKSAKELARVLSIGGSLYLGVPIGRERVEFNAHRVFYPSSVLSMFSDLVLIDFKAINDDGVFLQDANINVFDDANYSCGLFHFSRK